MDKWQIHSVSDLATGLMQFYTQPPIHASTGDALSVEWVCDVLNNGAAATLTDCTAAVYAIREDGATAMTSATISGNRITAVLPDAFFDVRGVVRAVMKLIDETNNAEMTVSEMSFKVGQGATDDIVDSDSIISIREGLIAIAQLPQTLAAYRTAEDQDVIDAGKAALTQVVRNDVDQSPTEAKKLIAQGNIGIVRCTQAEYDEMVEHGAGTIYLIVEGA